MTTASIKKGLLSILLMISLFLAYSADLDNYAEAYTEQGMQRALLTFAVSRSLNGVISVAQGTEIAISPAGVGLNFAPGQILDPINDLVERFSWVVMASATSLGIQRLFLEISSSTAISLCLLVLSLFFLMSLWLPRLQSRHYLTYKQVLHRALLILLFLRFTVPFVAIINHLVYLQFLQPEYEQSQAALSDSSITLQKINDQTVQANIAVDDMDILDKAKQWFENTNTRLNLSERLDAFSQAADEISQQVINMIVVFVLQTVVLPLLFLWLMIKVFKLSMARISRV